MKKILLIILLSFVSVVGVIGLAVGGMYLFGGFNEKIVYATNLSFDQEQMISDDTFFLKVTTTTEDVTRRKVKLHTSPGGDSVIDFPEYVYFDQYFPVVPKQVDGINFGGNVTLYASYDEEGSNQVAAAKCEILIDVPVEKVESVKVNTPNTGIGPNQVLTLTETETKLSNFISIYPERALMPYEFFGSKHVVGINDKKIFLQLTDVDGRAIQSTVAQFQRNNQVVTASDLVDGMLELRYTYNNARRQIEPIDVIAIETKGAQAQIKVNVYVYSTYQAQNDNSTQGNVSVVAASMKNNAAGFAIGNYEISSFVFDDSDKEILLNLSDGYDGATSIYLNNPEVTGSDINLNLNLQSSSADIDLRYNMYNMYLSIANEDEEDNGTYWTLFNDGYDANNPVIIPINTEVRNKFDTISTEKDDWCWKLKVTNFLAYKNYVDSNKRLKATLSYIEYALDAQGKETNTVSKKISQTFYIVPTIVEAEAINVNYATSGSVKVKSGSELRIVNDAIKVNRDAVENVGATVTVSPANSTIKDIRYYLSFAENYRGISAKPVATGKYMVSASFIIDENDESKSNFSSVTKVDNSGWCSIDKVVLKQLDYVFTKVGSADNDSTGFYKNKKIDIEVYITAALAIPDNNELFVVVFSGCSVTLRLDDVKFFEGDSNGQNYSSIPYLTINGIRYYTDFEYYVDQTTLTRFLYIPFNSVIEDSNLFKIVGIGSFRITAQLCYVDASGIVYWLNRSANITIDAYEDLESLKVYAYKGETKSSFTAQDMQYEENNATTYYLFINSSTMQTLKNYVSYGQVEVFAQQVFYKKTETGIDKTNALNTNLYTGIYNINRNAFSFGNFVAVEESGVVVGYKVPYTIGEVKTIRVNDEEYVPLFEIVVRALVNDSYVNATFVVYDDTSRQDIEENELIIEVVDKVFTEAFINYDRTVTNTAANAIGIYADYSSGVVYKAVIGNGSIDLSKINYAFDGDAVAASTELVNLRVDLDKGVNQEGLLGFNRVDGKDVLYLNNFPYFEDGILLTLTIEPTTMIDENSYYVWNSSSQSFVQTMYDLTKSLYFRVWGLNIEISVNASTNDVLGKADTPIYLVKDNNSLFNIQISKKGGTVITIGNNFDFSKVLGVNFGSENLLPPQVIDGKVENLTVTPILDFVEDTEVWFKFFVGSNANTNVIKIKDVGAATATLNTYTKTIKSPYILTTNSTAFTAPSSSIRFVTLGYGSGANSSTHSTLANVNMTATVTSTTLDDSYGIVGPISIVNNKNSYITDDGGYGLFLTLKSVPVDYSAVITVRVTLIDNNYRDVNIIITVTSSFNNEDIKINPTYQNTDLDVYEYVDLDADGYCNIDAGVEYSYIRSNNNSNNTIILDGLLADSVNAWVDKITSMSISFEDDDEIVYPIANNLMTNRVTIGSNTNFSINSYELNVNKKIKINFEIHFNDGGYIVITKKVKVRPNISLELTVSSITEGQQGIVLSSSNSYIFNGAVGAFDIDNNFEFDGTDIYSKDSFNFDSNVFIESESGHSYTIYARRPGDGYDGGSMACNGKTTIEFYYTVTSGNGYQLKFEFELLVLSDPTDLTVSLNAGANNTVTLSGRVLELKDSITDVKVDFYGSNAQEDELVNSLLSSSINFSNQTNKLTDIVLTSLDYNEAISVRVLFTFTFTNNKKLVVEKQVLLTPNISLQVSLPNATYNEGETINLNALTYTFRVNGQEDSTYENTVINSLVVDNVDSNCLEYDGENIIQVIVGAYANSVAGITNFVLRYDVTDEVDVIYSMYFVVEVEISQSI